ncbi:hypothetical protein AVEN_213295-1 [Araneus ventricosus]|uniref:Mariner Mos1 transposase n=1 Tax=Araneus ventricosus TaxID=182803 RepID=A0A4Y2INL5_ARAVE|nr:hypothetical protein AVEN_213295-1 [Araneus ventricosus]
MVQRINLKFLYKLGKSEGERHAILKQVYVDDTVTLKSVLSCDPMIETQYDPKTKRKSMDWCGPKSPKRKKNSVNCQMLDYCEVLKRFLARIRRVGPHLKQLDSCFFLHDKARPHTATLVKRFLAQHGVTELSHPPYSPDLTVFTLRRDQRIKPDCFQSPKLKVAPKGRRFTEFTHIQAALSRELKTVEVEEFSIAFDDLYTLSEVHNVRRGLF